MNLILAELCGMKRLVALVTCHLSDLLDEGVSRCDFHVVQFHSLASIRGASQRLTNRGGHKGMRERRDEGDTEKVRIPSSSPAGRLGDAINVVLLTSCLMRSAKRSILHIRGRRRGRPPAGKGKSEQA